MERADEGHRGDRFRPDHLTDADFNTARDAIIAAYLQRGMPSSGRNMSAIFTRL